jgi:hypothetical protein
VAQFRIASLSGDLPVAALFLSKDCAEAAVPGPIDRTASALRLEQVVDGSVAEVSYDIESYADEDLLVEVRGERWVQQDGSWYWDGCDAAS